MLYYTASKMYKTIVLCAGLAAACGSNCSHNHPKTACGGNDHSGSGQGRAHHDLADAGDELDQMDMDDMPQQPMQKPDPPTDEEIAAIRERLSLTDEDVDTIKGYVERIPAPYKDSDYTDDEIVKMFINHYSTIGDGESYEPQSREDLLREIKHLVEEELPRAMAHQQQQMMGQGDVDMPQAELTPEEMEAELDAMDDDDEQEVVMGDDMEQDEARSDL